MNAVPELPGPLQQEAQTLLNEHRQRVFVQTDRLFAVLMVIQWLSGIVAAIVISPRAWAGTNSSIHTHVYAAVFLGGAIAGLPIALALARPGATLTRYVIACGQMLFGALLIHLTGGRIETHFHVFVSLAFLALYRDWTVLIPATLVVAADHILRGTFYPQSVFGVLEPSPWRWVEHAAWVVFEDIVLIGSCIRGQSEMRQIAENTAQLHQSITERQRQERELVRIKEVAEAASRSKTAFLANMSHEIRTPMTSILGYSELLLDPTRSLSDRQDSLHVIRRNAKHLLELINNILDVSKIEADRMTLESLPVDLPRLAADVVSMIRPRAIDKDLAVRLDFDGPCPRAIVGDPLRLKQVLMNLVGNAVKFTVRGQVTLRVRSELRPGGSRIFFDVQDTGVGLTPEQIARLFQPFVQADDSATRRFGGTGLGLTISRRLARLMGGDITVSSQPGMGSTFHAEIEGGPVNPGEMLVGLTEGVIELSVAEQNCEDIRLQGRVLLAEDGPDNQALISLLLRQAGAEVIVAENGRIAVTKARAEKFDLVLMDMQMPELDGYGATSEMRRRGMTMPIVALTAHALAGDRAKCINAGCTDYLTKPVDRMELLRTLDKYLERAGTAASAEAPAAPGAPAGAAANATPAAAIEPAMRELVVEYVGRLPSRVAKLAGELEQSDLKSLGRTVHQLKGSGAGFGFPQITIAAAAAERFIIDQAPFESIAAEVKKLLETIRSVPGYAKDKEPAHDTTRTGR
jgi:signal transduction histidine kinase/DNA-binding NarL/FixJ family response regulator